LLIISEIGANRTDLITGLSAYGADEEMGSSPPYTLHVTHAMTKHPANQTDCLIGWETLEEMVTTKAQSA
jgi:hypothetical protein